MDIHLEKISMKFASTLVIDNIDFTVKSGELVSLLGPSGCGKSTTLSIIAGINKPTQGEIYFGDECITDKEPEERGIGMVFQNYALYPHMTVFKNIMFPLKMNKVNKEEAKKRVYDIAEIVQVEKLLDRKPKQLSGGQQQRVAIARALVKKPKVLLLDEPLSNLDARLRIEMREEIRRIQQKTGVTTIFVTHDQEEAMSISDNIIVMNDGKIQQYSRPEKLYNQPENIFTARFIGNPKINIIEGFKTDGKEIVIGIRAEDLHINQQNPMVRGKVTYIERMGRDMLVRVQKGDNVITAYAPKDLEINLNDEVGIGVNEHNIHWFEKASEKRITPPENYLKVLVKAFEGGKNE